MRLPYNSWGCCEHQRTNEQADSCEPRTLHSCWLFRAIDVVTPWLLRCSQLIGHPASVHSWWKSAWRHPWRWHHNISLMVLSPALIQSFNAGKWDFSKTSIYWASQYVPYSAGGWEYGSKQGSSDIPPAVMNLMFRGRLWVSHSKYEECWDSVGDNGWE